MCRKIRRSCTEVDYLGNEPWKIPMENRVSFERLEKTYLVSAKIVSKYGETYLPIFERLEAEYKKRIKTKEALQRALSSLEEMYD